MMEKEYIRCLTLAGLDPSGGAGLLADVKTFAALGCQGMAVATCLTVQNTLGVTETAPVDAGLVERQAEAVFADMPPHAVKIGMLATAANAHAVAAVLRRWVPPFVILDPVLASSGGFALAAADLLAVLRSELLPLCTVVAVNRDELEALSGLPAGAGYEEALRAARQLAAGSGCRYVLLKSGHFEETKTDTLLSNRETVAEAPGRRVETRNTHGTGCTLTSAFAALAARGLPPAEALKGAKRYVQQALESGSHVRAGRGRGGMNHFFAPEAALLKS